jgi:tRNA dimethylallyltransferase
MLENSKLKIHHSKLPILVGPTGVGKSEIALQLALKWEAEVISADAFQVYKGMEVGTVQPSKDWQKKITHHLIGVRSPLENWNAVEFAREAKGIIDEKTRQGKTVLIVGGSGFYIKALVRGAPQGTAPSPEVRGKVESEVGKLGNEKAHEWLKSRDPAAAKRIHVNDTHRVCRALEKTFSKPENKKGDFGPLGEEKVRFFGFERSRENLDQMLRVRTERMWKNGLLDETRGLLKMSVPANYPVWGAIGYSEAAAFFRGELTETEAIEKIFRRTRQYAKRQWTWFRHQHKVEWINLDNFLDTDSAVKVLMKKLQF